MISRDLIRLLLVADAWAGTGRRRWVAAARPVGHRDCRGERGEDNGNGLSRTARRRPGRSARVRIVSGGRTDGDGAPAAAGREEAGTAASSPAVACRVRTPNRC
ncbi:hypothetical protein GCM10010259_34680 [Streptomyces daghestanicus]|uniref:Secreted protein n=1 Tax=Streptomyces daghestanicus TaxID=66885 RepID=A0ABQ3Q1P3_9ACTN|nr:hypothetical protein GCM10010259_34680 [Streptomyces daghestanicus]GHI31196.1 hypothetical protein Sdagh_29260 [Streptomyces daghestanicus]